MSDLSELFDRDPLLLGDQDIAKIVTRIREGMAQYELGVKSVVAPREKKEKPTKSQKTLDLLKDLGLG